MPNFSSSASKWRSIARKCNQAARGFRKAAEMAKHHPTVVTTKGGNSATGGKKEK